MLRYVVTGRFVSKLRARFVRITYLYTYTEHDSILHRRRRRRHQPIEIREDRERMRWGAYDIL